MVNQNLPFSAAADRNKEAIGDALSGVFKNATTVVEVGSGTGQHARYLCERYNHLVWQPTEQLQYLESLRLAVDPVDNILAPVELDVAVGSELLQASAYSLAYSANTAHIMSMDEVVSMFAVVANCLAPNALFALYGPFNVGGQFTSEGNKQFDASLRSETPHMGIRDISELESIAHGLSLDRQIQMPSNNQILLWCAG